ncbi:MAG: TadE/TadG family type IV pilus assembly protein [Methylocella sp.]
MFLTRLRKNAEGAAMVEFAVVAFVLLVIVGGLFDFMYIFWQRNMLIKAVERGARIAAVSDPVVAGLSGVNMMPKGCTNPGDPWPPGGGTYGPFACAANIGKGYAISGTCLAAVDTIIYGRGGAAGACGAAGKNTYTIGMCDLSQNLGLGGAAVNIAYSDTGLGFCGRPQGPVPTITVTVTNAPFDYFFLGGLLGLANLNLNTAAATITGEDLSSSAPP